jgi:hypothetical protein
MKLVIESLVIDLNAHDFFRFNVIIDHREAKVFILKLALMEQTVVINGLQLVEFNNWTLENIE